MREEPKWVAGTAGPIAWLFLTCLASAAQNQPVLGPLPVDKVVERPISKSDVHVYWITLKAGNVLRVKLQEKGIDIRTTLIRALGRQVVAQTDFSYGYDRERLTALIEQEGSYVVVISTPPSSVAGTYQLMASVKDAATTGDNDEIKAERSLAEGIASRGRETLEDLHTAIVKLEETLPLWKKLGEPYWEGYTTTFLGLIYADLSEKPKALELLNQALSLKELAHDEGGAAYTLANMGIIYADLGERQKALELLNRALPLSQVAGHKAAEAYTHIGLGRVYDDLGDKQKALASYKQALPLCKAIGGGPFEVATLNNIGLIYYSLGELQKGLQFFNQSLVLSKEISYKRLEARTLNSVCQSYSGLGEKQKALECLDQAKALFEKLEDKEGKTLILNNLGQLYLEMGEKQKALDYFNQALPFSRASGDKRMEAAILNNLGMVTYALGSKPMALEYKNQALKIIRQIEDHELERGLLADISLIYRDLGKMDEARAYIDSALQVADSLRLQMPTQELRSSYTSLVHGLYEYYVDFLMRLHQRDPFAGFAAAALQASESARARSLLELLNESHADITQGVAPELLARKREVGQLLSAGAERLTRLLSRHEEQPATAKREVDDLTEQYEQIEAEIREKSPRYAALTQPQPLSLNQVQKLLDPDTLLLEYALGPERSYLWAVTPTSYQSYELPAAADIEAAAKKFYLSLQAPGVLRHSLPDGTRAARVYTAAEAREVEQLASKLSAMLLSPVAAQLGEKRLVIVPDGALQYLPFAALADPSRKTTWKPLILRHEIISLPSASALAIQRRELEKRKPAPQMVVVIADPVFSPEDPRVTRRQPESAGADEPLYRLALTRAMRDVGPATTRGDLPRLPGTRIEGEQIVALAGTQRSRLITDFSADRAAVESGELNRYRYVHFATHGLLDSQSPGLSALILSLVDEHGRLQNGYLRARDIFNLNLRAEVVGLSACQTGLGKDILGEGLVGLTQGFMYAGARRVVVSLWSVNDTSTARLMIHFYAGMLKEGKRPAEALRVAQIEMLTKRKKWRAPYYWAPFILQGEWR